MAVVFVTGAAGVIGTQLVNQLSDLGHSVFAADLKPRPEVFSDDVSFIHGDLNDMDFVQFAELRPDVVFHLAATFERTTETYSFYEENFRNNVALSHHVLRMTKELSHPVRFVFASSYLIYEASLYSVGKDQPAVSINELMPVNPRNLTGMAKLSTEGELQFLSNFSDSETSFVSARIFRGFGLGSRDVISRWIRKLLRNEPIEIFDADSSFDYIYCKDAASGLVELGMNSSQPGIVNLCSGESTSIGSIVSILRERFPHGTFKTLHESSIVEKSFGDIRRINSYSAWRAAYSVGNAIDEIITFEEKRLEDEQ